LNEHKNLIQLDGNQSKWLLWDEIKKIGFDSVRTIQLYLDRVNSQQAACIADLCVTYNEMANRLGDFGQYCPVSLALNNELVDCSEVRSMDFVAEYQGYYYKMFSATELATFLATPEQYVAPLAPRKLPPPHLLPRKRTATEVKELSKPVELNGFCPVTYYDGKQRYEALEQGFADYAAEYQSKLYFMLDKAALDKFLRKPDVYASFKLPHKLPPVKKQANLLDLPMTGYLEQTVADLLKKGLTAVGTYKPKFPFLSPSKSALLYVAYYLKGRFNFLFLYFNEIDLIYKVIFYFQFFFQTAYNTKSSDYRRKKYKQKLMYFEEKCQLIDFIHSQSTVKYKEPAKRTPEFNTKLENFFALKENTPTMNWLA
jgi:adenylate/nucleoside-diphosphate kinase